MKRTEKKREREIKGTYRYKERTKPKPLKFLEWENQGDIRIGQQDEKKNPPGLYVLIVNSVLSLH